MKPLAVVNDSPCSSSPFPRGGDGTESSHLLIARLTPLATRPILRHFPKVTINTGKDTMIRRLRKFLGFGERRARNGEEDQIYMNRVLGDLDKRRRVFLMRHNITATEFVVLLILQY